MWCDVTNVVRCVPWLGPNMDNAVPTGALCDVMFFPILHYVTWRRWCPLLRYTMWHRPSGSSVLHYMKWCRESGSQCCIQWCVLARMQLHKHCIVSNNHRRTEFIPIVTLLFSYCWHQTTSDSKGAAIGRNCIVLSKPEKKRTMAT